MLELLKKVYPLRLAPVSPDADKAVEMLKKELPFKVHEFKSGGEHNGWVVPQKWEVIKAEIRKGGSLIYDGKGHPLGVMGYAKSFKGKVSSDELKKHLTYRKDHPDAIGYHCDYYYKHWKSDWGFSIPYNLYKKLEEGDYDIDLQTSFEDGTMKVCDFFLPGRNKDTIIFNAHNCHAGQANDDISGAVVGVEVMKRLSNKKNRYSYRLMVAPEHLGTVFYLANTPKALTDTFKFCLFLEMMGNDNRIALQKSFTGKSLIDEASEHYLRHNFPDFTSVKFRAFPGNDETVWESPGYEIPTISLSRWPYDEYHTSLDNTDIIKPGKLENSVDIVLGIIDIIENNYFLQRKFKGLIALSNPKYDLYISPGTDPSISIEATEERRKWNYLMDCLPRYFDKETSVLDIAIKHGIEFKDIHKYLLKFKEKRLVKFISD